METNNFDKTIEIYNEFKKNNIKITYIDMLCDNNDPDEDVDIVTTIILYFNNNCQVHVYEEATNLDENKFNVTFDIALINENDAVNWSDEEIEIARIFNSIGKKLNLSEEDFNE